MSDDSKGDGSRVAPVVGEDFTGETAFSETTSKSWFQRLREALSGILTGVFLVLASIGLLFWNEGRAVKTANALYEGAGQVVEANAQTPDRALDGRLVHVSGPLRVTTQPRDGDLDISAPALRLERKVEMYQWRENKTSRTEKKLGGGEETVTTYAYERVWSDSDHKSEDFRQPQGHANPPFPIRSKTFAGSARLGGYDIGPDRLAGLGASAPMALDSRQVASIGARLGRPASLAEGGAFAGRDPAQPQVGDVRVSYAAARVDQASFVAAQKGTELVPFIASNGRMLFLMREGSVSAQDMFEIAQQGNTVMTWMLRGLGLVLAIAGFTFILRIAGVIADVVPVFGSIVGAGTGAIAILLGVSLATLVASIAWIFHRPLVGLGLLAVAALAMVLIWQKARAARPAGKTAPA